MAMEKNISGIVDDFQSGNINYTDDIERIREVDSESVKTESGKLGIAGVMGLSAAAGLILIGLLETIIPGNLLGPLYGVLTTIGIGASVYGIISLLRKLTQKTLNIPSINVLRKVASEQTASRPYAKQQQGNQQNVQQNQQNFYPNSTQRKEMRRSRSNRVFAGVAGGLGEYFGVSPALIRFAFMIATGATSGMFFFIYLLMALIIPKNYDDWRNKNNK